MEKESELYREVIMQLNPKLSTQEWNYFQRGFALQTLKPKEYFIEAGKRNQRLGFVTSGLIRGSYVDLRGNDITTVFVAESQWATDYPSLLAGRPSRYNFQCLESTTIITVSYAHICECYDRFAGFERIGRLIAEIVLSKQQRRVESFQFDSAEQRYLDFVKENASLFNRISLTHLSSFLGIERASLSRIRKNL